MIETQIMVKDIPKIPREKVYPAVQTTLLQSWTIIKNNAKRNSPLLTWTLRRSIDADYGMITQWKVVVGTNVQYATMREYNNRQNPHTKFYMKRAKESNIERIRSLFLKNIRWVFV